MSNGSRLKRMSVRFARRAIPFSIAALVAVAVGIATLCGGMYVAILIYQALSKASNPLVEVAAFICVVLSFIPINRAAIDVANETYRSLHGAIKNCVEKAFGAGEDQFAPDGAEAIVVKRKACGCLTCLVIFLVLVVGSMILAFVFKVGIIVAFFAWIRELLRSL